MPVIDSLAGTTFKCAVSPPTALVHHETACGATIPNSNYAVVFKVFAPAGSYTYQWQVPSPQGQSIYSGCTSTSGTCTLTVSRVGDHDNTIGVIVTNTSTNETFSDVASYSTPATCWQPAFGGWVWC